MLAGGLEEIGGRVVGGKENLRREGQNGLE